ncbi:MAG TPA: division/cell wall cluster transcriptional repressor MraZ [Melioribacteraceae bacterium]|nr:division/cell wall cluster transcriptional repressor MraZ [Melioribacteraceae bacterium]
MFLGSFKYSVDSKGRISIPARFRKYVTQEANDTFIITRGIVQCIDIYPQDSWKNEVLVRINQLDDFDPDESAFKRMLLELAAEDKLDSQARLLVPKNLLEFAGIDKDVLILGQNKKIEIWNPAVYESHKKENLKPFAEIAKQVMQKKPK